MSEYIEAEYDYFICPYCGAKIRIDPEIFSNYAMDDEEEIYCEDCDHEFIALREVNVSYSTRKSNDNDKEQQ